MAKSKVEEMVEDVAPPSPPAPEPAKEETVRVTVTFGFYDDDNVLHYWNAGQVVTDPAEIALLRERMVRFQHI